MPSNGLDPKLQQEVQAAPRRRKAAKKKPASTLYHWRDLPEYLKDNEYIFSGYRANTGLWGSLKSLFRIHNESGNVWSHLTGFFFFIFLLVCIIRSPPTPLAIRKHDLEVLWDAVSARIDNASSSLKHQMHNINLMVRDYHLSQAMGDGMAHIQHALGPANTTRPSSSYSLRSLQHSLVDSVHELEGRLASFSAGMALPRMPDRLHSSLASVQHTLHDGLASVQHTLRDGIDGLTSVHNTLRDGIDNLVGGVQLPEAVSSGVQHFRAGIDSSWGHVSGSMAHTLHTLEDFVSCHILQNTTPSSLASHVGQGFHWMYAAVDDMLHRVVLSSVKWPVPRWPIYVFMGGVMICLLTSAIAHLFGCCNEHVAMTIWRFDYAGIVANIVSSFYPSVYYAFMCQPVYQWFYLLSISICGAATLAMSLMDRFQTAAWRATRAGAFVVLALLAIIPYLHLAIAYPRFEKLWDVGFIDLTMAAFYLGGAAIYALRVPERWAPGRFDIFFHSHQLFHICVVGGAYFHYLAVMELVRWRDASGGCAIEVVDKELVRHAVSGGEGLIDMHAVVEYLQRRMQEFFNLPYDSCPVRLGHDSLLASQGQLTCPWPHS